MRKLFIIILLFFMSGHIINAQFDYGTTGGFTISSKIDIQNYRVGDKDIFNIW